MIGEIRTFDVGDTEQAVALWQRTGLVRSWNDPYADITRKLSFQPDLFLVCVADARLIGTVMAGYDGHRGSLGYVATDPDYAGQGVATRLISRAEELLIDLGCPKVNLMVRTGNENVLEFYDRLGYEQYSVFNAGKRLIADE